MWPSRVQGWDKEGLTLLLNTRCHCLTLHEAPPPGLTDAPWNPRPSSLGVTGKARPMEGRNEPDSAPPRALSGLAPLGPMWRKLRIREGTGSCGLWGHPGGPDPGPHASLRPGARFGGSQRSDGTMAPPHGHRALHKSQLAGILRPATRTACSCQRQPGNLSARILGVQTHKRLPFV